MIGLPFPARAILAVLALGPGALAIGLPFPCALQRWKAVAPSDTAWAWGLNSFASVLASVVAIILAMQLGFSATLLIGAACYAAAAPLGAHATC